LPLPARLPSPSLSARVKKKKTTVTPEGMTAVSVAGLLDPQPNLYGRQSGDQRP
jgi:hypothetical protein